MNKRGGRRRKERERRRGADNLCLEVDGRSQEANHLHTGAHGPARDKNKIKKRREQEVVAIIVDGCCVSLSFLSFVFKRYISFRGKDSSG